MWWWYVVGGLVIFMVVDALVCLVQTMNSSRISQDEERAKQKG